VSSFPLPPPDLVSRPTDTTGQAVLDVAIAVGMVVLVAAAVYLGRRYRTWVPMAIVLGSTASALIEPLPDLVAGLWYYAPGQQTIYTAYGNSLPTWTFFSYPVYYAGFGLIFWRVVESGADRRRLLLLCVPMAIYLALTELFLINSVHLYTYYGPGAFRVGHFPLFICLLNTTIVLTIGTVGARLRRSLPERDQGLPAFFLPGVSMVIGLLFLPAVLFTVVHTTDPSQGLIRLTTALAMVAAVAMMYVTTCFVPAGGFAPLTVPQITPSSASRAISVDDMPSNSPSTHSLSSP
jgi:hypothetical protein